MKIEHSKIGICGLYCGLCPMFHSEGESRCGGCKSEGRMTVGCVFITCAVKRKGVEFCWDCDEDAVCSRWRKHRESGKEHDSFKCYQKLEDDIHFIRKNGVGEFEKSQEIRESLLKDMLREFNEGRSKTYYCIAATVLEIDELEKALNEARSRSNSLEIKEKSGLLHSLLDKVSEEKNYRLKLRK